MLNLIWTLMILLGVGVGIVTGNMEAVGNGALEAAGSAVTLCITMMGILSMWTGLMQVARASGLLEKMAAWLSPVIRFLFPGLKGEDKAKEYIAKYFESYPSIKSYLQGCIDFAKQKRKYQFDTSFFTY